MAENYSSLPLCGSSKRLQLRRQDLKSNNMAASKDGGCAAMAEALGGKRSQRERGIRSIVGRWQEKIAAGAGQKHVGRRQEKIAAGVRQKLALSSARTSMLLCRRWEGGRVNATMITAKTMTMAACLWGGGKLVLSSVHASMLLGSKLRGGGCGTAIEGPP